MIAGNSAGLASADARQRLRGRLGALGPARRRQPFDHLVQLLSWAPATLAEAEFSQVKTTSSMIPASSAGRR